MGEFKKLNVKLYEKKSSEVTPDALYWKKYGAPVFLKEFGPIDYIDFSPKEPHYFAVTSSVRVQVYSPVTRLLYKNLSRFQKSAYGGNFRNDGRLLCSGGEECTVKLFDVSTKSLLRVFKGHAGPVHRSFFTADNTRIASFSDDASVSVWDIPSEKRLLTFNEHSDYVRAGAVSPASANTILSASYDGVINMYDVRSENIVFTIKHDAPVESLLFLPSGGVFLSAGGSEIKVWDAFMGGRLLNRIHQHHKTVTSLRLASNGSRLLSSSLDRHVNVYDVVTFSRLHTLTYPNSILSLGISQNDDTIAVGMVDGLVSVCRREADVTKSRKEPHRTKRKKIITDNTSADVQVGTTPVEKRADYENLLRRFDHTKALNKVLTSYTINRFPEIVAVVIKELLARNSLHSALAGHEERTVVPFLRFVTKYIGDARFTRLLLQALEVFLDVYEDSISECGATAVALFKPLYEIIKQEVDIAQELACLEGSIRLLLSASTTENTSEIQTDSNVQMKPSATAQGFVVNVS